MVYFKSAHFITHTYVLPYKMWIIIEFYTMMLILQVLEVKCTDVHNFFGSTTKIQWIDKWTEDIFIINYRKTLLTESRCMVSVQCFQPFSTVEFFQNKMLAKKQTKKPRVSFNFCNKRIILFLQQDWHVHLQTAALFCTESKYDHSFFLQSYYALFLTSTPGKEGGDRNIRL